MSAPPKTTSRADRLTDVLRERDLHALLVTDLSNLRWLTGFTGSAGAAVVGTDGTRRFVTDFRYLTQSAEHLDDSWARGTSSDIRGGVPRQLPDEGELRLGFDDANLSVRNREKLGRLAREGIELAPGGGGGGGRPGGKDARRGGRGPPGRQGRRRARPRPRRREARRRRARRGAHARPRGAHRARRRA